MSAARKGKTAGKAGGVKDVPTEELTQEELQAKLAAGELKILSKEEILESDDLVEELLYVPEWGGVIKIRSLTKGQQIEVDERATVDDEIDGKLMIMFMFLEGVAEPKFDLKDQEGLKERNGAAFDKVTGRLFELSALGVDAAKAREARFRD